MEFLSHILTARWNAIMKGALLLYFWPMVGFLNEGFLVLEDGKQDPHGALRRCEFSCWNSEVTTSQSKSAILYEPGVCLSQKYYCMFGKYETNSSQCACSICHEGIIFVLQHRQAPVVQEGIETTKYFSVLPCQSTKSCLLIKSINLMYPLPWNRRYWGFSRARKASAICNYMYW